MSTRTATGRFGAVRGCRRCAPPLQRPCRRVRQLNHPRHEPLGRRGRLSASHSHTPLRRGGATHFAIFSRPTPERPQRVTTPSYVACNGQLQRRTHQSEPDQGGLPPDVQPKRTAGSPLGCRATMDSGRETPRAREAGQSDEVAPKTVQDVVLLRFTPIKTPHRTTP